MALVNYINELQLLGLVVGFILATYFGCKLVSWGKRMPKGAFIFLAIFPLLSLFPIPPTVFKNVEKAKQEQRKRKSDSGDDPNLKQR